MAFLLDDVGAYLAAAGIGLTEGTNLFASLMPETPDSCVTLTAYGGGEPPIEVMGPTLTNPFPAIELPRFQVSVRDASYPAAETTARLVYRELLRVTNQTLSSTLYQRIESLQSPFFSHRDDSRRTYFKCNYRVHRTPTS